MIEKKDGDLGVDSGKGEELREQLRQNSTVALTVNKPTFCLYSRPTSPNGELFNSPQPSNIQKIEVHRSILGASALHFLFEQTYIRFFCDMSKCISYHLVNAIMVTLCPKNKHRNNNHGNM